jgi:hypothetical protein
MMPLFRRLIRQTQRDPMLLGTWSSDPLDAKGDTAYGQAEMTFHSDGKLTYTIVEEDGRAGIMNLVWRTEGQKILTDQPSHPDSQSSNYEFGRNGMLTISFGGEPARFIRKD